MKRGLKLLVILTLALVATTAGIFASYRANPAAPAASPAQQAAVGKLMAQTLPDPQGSPQALRQWQGKVLVVNFWATWCPPCRKEIPAFSALHTRFQDKGAQFVGISIDTDVNVRKFQADQKVSYPLLIASPALVQFTEDLGNAAQGLPFTLILDRRGNIALIKLGTLSEAELDAKLAELTRS